MSPPLGELYLGELVPQDREVVTMLRDGREREGMEEMAGWSERSQEGATRRKDQPKEYSELTTSMVGSRPSRATSLGSPTHLSKETTEKNWTLDPSSGDTAQVLSTQPDPTYFLPLPTVSRHYLSHMQQQNLELTRKVKVSAMPLSFVGGGAGKGVFVHDSEGEAKGHPPSEILLTWHTPPAVHHFDPAPGPFTTLKMGAGGLSPPPKKNPRDQQKESESPQSPRGSEIILPPQKFSGDYLMVADPHYVWITAVGGSPERSNTNPFSASYGGDQREGSLVPSCAGTRRKAPSPPLLPQNQARELTQLQAARKVNTDEESSKKKCVATLLSSALPVSCGGKVQEDRYLPVCCEGESGRDLPLSEPKIKTPSLSLGGRGPQGCSPGAQRGGASGLHPLSHLLTMGPEGIKQMKDQERDVLYHWEVRMQVGMKMHLS